MRKYIKYLFGLFKKYIRLSIAMVVLQIIITLLNLINPVLLQKIIDDGVVIKNEQNVIVFALVSALCLVFLNMLRFVFNKLAIWLKTNQSLDLKIEIMENMSKSNIDFYQKKSSGDILKTLESDVAMLEEINVDWIVTTFIEVIGGVFAIGWILKINYILLCIVVVAEFLIILFQKKIVSILSANAVHLRELSGKLMGTIEEYVTNIICAIYGKTTKYMRNKFISDEKIFLKKLNRQYNIAEGNQLISNTIDGLLSILIYLIGGIFVINNKMSYGELIAFSQYIALIISPVLIIVNSFSKIELAIVSLDKVNELLNIPFIKSGNYNIKCNSRINISFKDVFLGYGEKTVLKNVDIDLEDGNIYAFIGKNGSGKSTIIKALYRMIEIQKGEIFVCGQKIEKWNIEQLRKNIGVVSQEVFILNDTIYNNLTLGREVKEEELQKVIDIVDLEDMICLQEKGINSEVGENGVNLSGGQRQKIAIARMLLLGAKVLIFDEATSAVDNYAQEKIVKGIQKNYNDRLVIIIAHRLSAIKCADYVYYFENKQILEQGTFAELESKKGKAFDLFIANS